MTPSTTLRSTLCAVLLALGLAACDTGIESGFNLPTIEDENCAIDIQQLFDTGIFPDEIPALNSPTTVAADSIDFLVGTDRVIGFIADGQPYAVPHNILWWHEVASFNFSDMAPAITYSPTTGSSIGLDRTSIGGSRLAVAGLLYQNSNIFLNLVDEEATIFPQMSLMGGCGPLAGQPVEQVPVWDITWEGWETLYPNTLVVNDDTGYQRDYTANGYPYGNYEALDNEDLIDNRTPIDDRRPPKERVLGIPNGEGGVAYPFNALDQGTERFAAVQESVLGGPAVIFWDGQYEAAMAYRPTTGTQSLTFSVEEGAIVDAETGSTWDVTGRATSGPLSGERLEPIEQAHTAFWFAWAAFHPDTRLWPQE